VIPVFNAASTVVACVESARRGGTDVEVVVVDDGSTDDTVAAVRDAFGDAVTVLEHDWNIGPAAARNRGAQAARGRWILFLDADDLLVAGSLDRVEAATHDDSGLLTTRYALGADAASEAGFFAGAFAVRHDVFASIDGYDPHLRYGENSELQMRAEPALAGRGLQVQDVDVTTVRLRSVGRSRNYDRARMDAAIRVLEKHEPAMRADRRERAKHEAIVAVNARRIGEWRIARRYGFRAIGSDPTVARNYLRLARILVAPLTERARPGAATDRDPARS
jgi:glycosyltransferase involved in cell wall biosynthesis